MCYPKSISNGKTIPIDSLDHVLYQGDKPEVTYYCPSTGDVFSDDAITIAFDNIKNSTYPCTDHTPFSFYPTPDTKVGYLSLDNSLRCATSGIPLSNRLEQICLVVRKMNCDIMFYSES